MDRVRQKFVFTRRFGNLGAGIPGADGTGPLTIDMTPDGRIGDPPSPPRLSWPMRIAAAGVIVAVLAGFAASAVILLWLASILIPIALAAGLIAYLAFRFQMWRLRRTRPADPGFRASWQTPADVGRFRP